MYDEPFDWQDYMRRQDRTLSAAGGVPPTMETQPPQGGDLEDPMPQQPAQRTQPTNLQYTLEDRLGIKTHGPAADQQNEAIEQFDQGEQGFEGATKQGRPMQYGMDEPLGMSPGPLTPDRAAAKFMALNPGAHRRQEGEQGDVLGLNIRQHSLGSADRAAKNQAYEARVQADRERRAQERDAARNRPSAVEARARLSSDVDRVRGLMEGPSQPGGPTMTNMGGALLLGPGFGRRENEYGRNSFRTTYDPQLEDKQQHQLTLAEMRAKLAELGEVGKNKRAGDALGQRGGLASQRRQDDIDEEVAAGTNHLAAILGDLQRRQSYAKENVGRFFGPKEEDLLDVTWDREGKVGPLKKGTHATRVNILRNQLKRLEKLDPSRRWAQSLDEQTVEFMKSILAKNPAAAAGSLSP